MAILASRAIATLVRIVLRMAGDALRACGTGRNAFGMAGDTGKPLVPTEQGKPGLLRMIEPVAVPRAGVVALLAVRSQRAIVWIVLLMARDTFADSLLKLVVRVAARACERLVRATEHKASLGVVKARLKPLPLVVAAAAI